uniref:Uncharacterized protein n=1 Tax=Anguilla anguilla TaxID=7936 RepID=A0A0E9UFS4_ANGAN
MFINPRGQKKLVPMPFEVARVGVQKMMFMFPKELTLAISFHYIKYEIYSFYTQCK